LRAVLLLISLTAPIWQTEPVHSGDHGGSDGTGDHWAFQPVREPEISVVHGTGLNRNPIDAFVGVQLEQRGLSQSPEADRRTLIRRVSYAVTGLPPSPDEVERFVDDARPTAYERLVDRLLQSPQYGEHWARRWLDVARYSDTKGYVYAREERFWVHAWAYRDWVVRALNRDLPYDRFLLLQLAADQVPDREHGDLEAMGFLTIGRRFLGVQRDIIDDRIDVVCRGTMGLTVACARCHDHKYDPIATADYYSLYGVFDSCAEQLVRVDDGNVSSEDAAQSADGFESELEKRQAKLDARLAAVRSETSERVRQRIGDYLRAQTELHKYPAAGFDQVFQKTDILPAFVRQWEEYLRAADRRQDPVFMAWHAYAELNEKEFSSQAASVANELRQAAIRVHPLVAAALGDHPPASFAEVIAAYARLFSRTDADWKAALDAAEKADIEPPIGLPDPAAEQLRQVLYGVGAPCVVPDESMSNIEQFFDTDSVVELWKLQAEVDRWIIDFKGPIQYALILRDRAVPSQPRVFRRGNPLEKGDEIPRRFLPFLSNADSQPFQHGSGRLELAEAIIRPTNPLTARVIVNRLWAHHFGRGLVATPSDFGTRASSPSQPELLDWLSSRFVTDDAWSLKRLHRRILLSATFRQSSRGPRDPGVRDSAMQVDPDNRLLWRTAARRLTFEEFRDSMLCVTDSLDRRIGGKPSPIFERPFPTRRTIYGLVDRQFLSTTLRTFDFANPDLHIPQRSETTVPQQALFFMNHPLVLERARSLAAFGAAATTPSGAVRILFRQAYQREPTVEELAESLAFVEGAGKPLAMPEQQRHSGEEPAGSLTGWEQLAQLVLCANEFLFVD
jgi:hypothetical protein